MPETPAERLVVRKDDAGQVLATEIATTLLRRAQEAQGNRRYLIELPTPDDYDPFAIGADDELAEIWHERSNAEMDHLAEALATDGGRIVEVSRLLPLPLLVVEADAEGLQALIETPLVRVIYEDFVMRPFLHETLPIVQAGSLHSAGGTGSGHSVAVLDSGVQRSHPMFSGKIVGEACFASGFLDYPYPGHPGCPVHGTCTSGHCYGSTEPGSSEACTGTTTCAHGTHVAAIAIGGEHLTPQGPTIQGITPSANLVSIRTGSLTCDTSVGCVEYKLSDTADALSWVYSQRNVLNIASVNISYGEYTLFTSYCDSTYSDLAQKVNLLTGSGVAVVAASGNYALGVYYPGKLAVPACLQNVISVGAVKKDGTFAEYSNANPTLDLLAPGGFERLDHPYTCTGNHSCVLSALVGSTYGYMAGTSMAAPHVAGAIAGLRSLMPKSGAGVHHVVQHLKNTGQSININQNGQNFVASLIKLGEAVSAAPPAPPTHVQVDRMYCYGSNWVHWTSVAGSPTHYQLQSALDAGFTSPFMSSFGTPTSHLLIVGEETWVRARACHGPNCSAWTVGGPTAIYVPSCL